MCKRRIANRFYETCISKDSLYQIDSSEVRIHYGINQAENRLSQGMLQKTSCFQHSKPPFVSDSDSRRLRRQACRRNPPPRNCSRSLQTQTTDLAPPHGSRETNPILASTITVTSHRCLHLSPAMCRCLLHPMRQRPTDSHGIGTHH